VETILQFGSLLVAMLVLLGCSAFFSCSEAALFYLGREERRAMQAGSAPRRLAIELLKAPQRLLTAILFWNLLINLAFFALTSIIALRLKETGSNASAGIVSVGSLMAVVVFGEMIPKMVGVIRPVVMASLVSVPLTVAVRALDAVMPVLTWINLLSRRVLFPRWEPEAYLELGDLERAITLGATDESLARQERAVLQNVIALTDLRVEELMRPRTLYRSFRPPVHLADLDGQVPAGGYLLVTEADSDEVAASISLRRLIEVPGEHLEKVARSVIYVPWCTSVASALDELRRQDRHVAAVINEHGETIGIVTMDEILESVFHPSSRSERTLRRPSLVKLSDGGWEVTGMTTLRRIAKRLRVELPETHSVTVAGVLHEELQRLPVRGDLVHWGELEFTVLAAPEHGALRARVDREPPQEQKP
jgi:CBS domain containing-hemolysin-like protein